MLKKLVQFCLLILCAGSVRASVIDESVNLFFPANLRDIQYSQTLFRLFWWNFVVIDPGANGVADWDKAQEICQKLHDFQGQELSFVICGQDQLKQFKALLKQWAQDLPLRKPFPESESARQWWLKKSRQTIAQIAMLPDRNLLELMREDPFGSWEEFVDLNQSVMATRFTKQNGFLLDAQSQRILIPVQFRVAPQLKETRRFFEKLPWGAGLHLVGTHQASYQNERTVQEDLNKVSWVGGGCLLGLILFLVFQKRARAVFLIIPISFGMASAALVTIWFYGSIHGLTLAFGSAIAGLALDYALHGAFNSESKQTWKSNAVGLITTLAGLGVLIFCRIPLIQQMMFFSIVGIILGFLISYLMCESLPQFFHLEGLKLKLPKANRGTSILIGVFLLGWIGIWQTEFSFDLRRFNFQTSEQKRVNDWFYQSEVNKPTYIFLESLPNSGTGPESTNGIRKETEVVAGLGLGAAAAAEIAGSPAMKAGIGVEAWKWAQKSGAEYDGVYKYLPPLAQQSDYLQSWRNGACSFFQRHWNEDERKFFRTFLDRICHLENIEMSFANKSYLEAYVGANQGVGLVRPVAGPMDQALREAFPLKKSIAESVQGFAKLLREDLAWMIPLALLLSIVVLYWYYRKTLLIFTSILPFLTGGGVFFIATVLLKDPVDLISVLGLVMVFGFSIDYGVFATDLFVKNDEALQKMNLKQLERSVFSTLTLAGFTNLVGFLPLVFAQHVVLHQLGVALFFGTVGTYLGALWGVPVLLRGRNGN